MANTYNWVVNNLHAKIESDGLENVIQTIHWRLQATDENENVADVYGSCGLDALKRNHSFHLIHLQKRKLKVGLNQSLTLIR